MSDSRPTWCRPVAHAGVWWLPHALEAQRSFYPAVFLGRYASARDALAALGLDPPRDLGQLLALAEAEPDAGATCIDVPLETGCALVRMQQHGAAEVFVGMPVNAVDGADPLAVDARAAAIELVREVTAAHVAEPCVLEFCCCWAPVH